jgi:hypothetical protein
MDEIPKKLLADLREPMPTLPGMPERIDYEYQRNGVTDLFMFFEPLAGKRFVEIDEQRRRLEWAHVMRILSDELYPEAEVIVVVLDNLNIHTPAAFYLAFEPEEARRLVERFEFHFTPIKFFMKKICYLGTTQERCTQKGRASFLRGNGETRRVFQQRHLGFNGTLVWKIFMWQVRS